MLKRYADIPLAALVLAWVVYNGLTFFTAPYYGFSLDFRTGQVLDAQAGSALQVGDRVISLNDRPIGRPGSLVEARRGQAAGTPLSVEFEREGKRLRASQQEIEPRAMVVATQLGGKALGILFLAVGLLVALRPTGKPGQLFFLFCAAMAYLLAGPPLAGVSETVVRLSDTLARASLLFGASAFLHFFLLFPRPHPLTRRLRWLGWSLYVPPAAFLVVLEGLQIASQVSFVPQVIVQALGRSSALVALAYFVWAVLVFVDSYRRIDDPVEKEKLRWLVWGVAISIVPAALLLGLLIALGLHIPYLDVLVLACLSFLPASFAYAILSHRLMDIEVVVNRGLVYSAITLLLVVVFIVVENVLAELSMELTGKSSFALAMGAAIVMAALVDPVKKRIQSSVDHLFFAYKVKLREGLKDLAEELSFITDLERMEELLLRRLVDLAHVSRAALFLREEGKEGYVLVEAVGVPEWKEGSAVGDSGGDGGSPRFDANDPFVIKLLRGTGPLSLETLPEAEFEQRLEHAGVEILRRVDAAVSLPLRLRADLTGFLLLSRRKNRDLFNRDELDLLNGLAIQAAGDLSNARLQTRSRRLEAEVVSLREELLTGLRAFLDGPGRTAGDRAAAEREARPRSRQAGSLEGEMQRGESTP
jgi:GAF domain-containing protein